MATSAVAFVTYVFLGSVALPLLVAAAAAAGVGTSLVPAGSRVYAGLVVLLAVVAAGAVVPSVLFEQDAVHLGAGVVPLAVAASLAVLVGFIGGTRRTELFAPTGA